MAKNQNEQASHEEYEANNEEHDKKSSDKENLPENTTLNKEEENKNTSHEQYETNEEGEKKEEKEGEKEEKTPNPEDLDTIEKIDAYISTKHGGSLGNEEERTATSDNGNLPQIFQYANGKRMSSSGASNDCLIHSFLTSVSPNFRKLSKQDKEAFASLFRRKIYSKLLKKQTEEDKNRIQGNEFLVDADILNLSKLYKVQFLVFEGEKKGMKACTSIHFHTQGRKIYMLWNYNNLHFESVRDVIDGYSIQLNKALWLFQNTRCDKENKCVFRTGDKVEYKDKTYRIAYTVVDPETQACLHVYLATEEQYATYEAMSLEMKIEEDLEEKLQFILADIDEIAKPKMNGTRNHRKPQRATRKNRR